MNTPTTRGAPLVVAVGEGDEAVMRAVLEAGANPNVRSSYGTPALTAAIEGGSSLEVVSLFLQLAVDVNAKASHGITALHSAVRAQNLDIVKALIAAGADVNAAQENGETPIQTARYLVVSDEIIAALVEAGAKE